ncbi:MAG: hypothetical protein CUN54_08415, partial [Phototrophicales bacterium]
MATNQQPENLELGLNFDERTARLALQMLKQMRNDLGTIEAETGQADLVARRYVDAIEAQVKAFQEADRSTRRIIDDVQELRAEQLSLEQATEQTTDALEKQSSAANNL